MGHVTVQLELAAPAAASAQPVAAARRRARAHFDNPAGADLGRVAAEVAELTGDLGLGGHVRLDPHGVTLEIEGPAADVEDLLVLLRAEPDGWIDGGDLPPVGATEFAVLAVSAGRTSAAAHRGSDVALNVGQVIGLRGLRAPARLIDAEGRERPGCPIEGAARLLTAGRVLAAADRSRYRLYVDATWPAAVAIVAGAAGRARNGSRDGAVVALCPDLAWARRLGHVDERQGAALTSRRNPVLLIDPLASGPAADLAATGSKLALTLPGCALTHLLAEAVGRPLAFVDLAPLPGCTTPVPPAEALLIPST